MSYFTTNTFASDTTLSKVDLSLSILPVLLFSNDTRASWAPEILGQGFEFVTVAKCCHYNSALISFLFVLFVSQPATFRCVHCIRIEILRIPAALSFSPTLVCLCKQIAGFQMTEPVMRLWSLTEKVSNDSVQCKSEIQSALVHSEHVFGGIHPRSLAV